MAPKGTNSKKEQGRAKKAETETKKKESAAEAAERKEADKWAQGSKPTKEDKEQKRKAELARKAENAKILAEEEAITQAKPKVKPAAKKKSVPAPAGPGAIAAGGGLAAVSSSVPKEDEAAIEQKPPPEEFSATGLDDALDLLEAVTQKMDKASLGQAAAGIEKHPERRFKAAFEAYQERELPSLKVDYPGLRLQQYKEILFKQFQKSPENPFNQVTIAYDASKEEKVEALKKARESTENRMRQL